MRSSFAYCNVGRKILTLKCTKFDFRWGSVPSSLWELTALSAGELTVLPRPLRCNGPIIRERRGKESEVGKGEGAEGRGGSPLPIGESGATRGGREEGQGEELWLGRPGTSFSTLSTAHSFALQSMRESSLKNPKCTKTHVGPGLRP